MFEKKLIICPHCKHDVIWDTQRNQKKLTARNTFMCSNWECYYADSFNTPIVVKERSHHKLVSNIKQMIDETETAVEEEVSEEVSTEAEEAKETSTEETN